MNIRRLDVADAAAYRSLTLAAFAAHPEAFTSTVEERARVPMSWWEKRLRDGEAPDVVFGAFEGSELIGTAGLQFSDRFKTRHKATLFGMYVDQAHAGQGAGRALVDACLAYARTRGVSVVQLTVTEGNTRAYNLYRRSGFRDFGVEPCAVLDDAGYRSKIHMWLPLAQLAP
ncbi:GNAT family N-acetyltransferase [Massilia arenosa]|uniref:GNAT family N-acetyltransferase n=1 Tax=Zemynaea arenosa TaxID=2561931 RepID=A0A4Y9SXJ2_9BURK|nr:GNAT family N-acetyltransferase [Massilia arenosa]TFW29353.1 GNAT family N-acetyltransferase [Massilia arenosa]